MKRLSIIVPMFRVEECVERCIRSLEFQDIPRSDYEIICINDGSPDNCRDVVIRLQQEFDNINLIDQENRGVSHARNAGIDSALGRYLMCIDSDDYIDENCLERILETSERMNTQVLFLGYTITEGDKSWRWIAKKAREGLIYTGIEAYFLARSNEQSDPDRMVAVLFEAEFLNGNNLRYLSGVPYLEDGEFGARILCLAERCAFDGNSFYQRTTRPGSATNSNLFQSEKATKGFLLAANNLKRFQLKLELSEKQRCFLNQPISKFVLLALNSALQKPIYPNFIKIRKNLIVEDFKTLELKGVVNPYNYLGLLYNYFIFFFFINSLLKEIGKILKPLINSPRKIGSNN